MRIGEMFREPPAPVARPGAVPSPSPSVADHTSLGRVLPPGMLVCLPKLLVEQQTHKLATIAREMETYRDSPLLMEVPSDAATCHQLADILNGCATAIAELEASRKARVGPLNDEVKQVNALYKLISDPLSEIKGRADKLIVAHNQAERARIQREQEGAARRQAEAAEAEAAAVARAQEASSPAGRQEAMAAAEAASREIATVQAQAPVEAPRAYRSETGTVSIRKTYKLAGFNPDKIPDEYWTREPVLEAVRKELAKAVRAGAREIPGCAIEIEEGTTARV